VTDVPAINVDAALDEILNPLRDTLAQIDEAIAAHERTIEQHKVEIAALRQQRAKPARVLAAAQRPPGKKPGPKKNGGPTGVAPEKLDQLTDWLRANLNGEAFHASGIDRREDFTLMSQATLSHALSVLADQGVIRLDHRGSGGAKFYKLTGVNE
jgi:DNA-binding transcriptional ArsR family regulator